MTPRHWSVICNETDAPALWKTWLSEKCVAIGWPPVRHHLEGPTEKTSWDIARARAQEVEVGDIVIPYLMRYRFGIPGEVVRIAISDSEWKPTVAKGGYRRNLDDAELGRRIELKWLEKDVPPPDKVALVPVGMRTSGGEVKQTIERLRSERYARFTEIIGNPSNWIVYEPLNVNLDVAESNAEEESEPSTEPDPEKLVVQETQIRSIFAKNLQRIESGLVKHPDFAKLEEVTFDLGRLDILCVDSKNRPTIIELQLGYLDDGHIGKICRYYGWFTLRYGANVRAILLFENAIPEVLEAYRKALPWLEMKKFSWVADIRMESC